MRRKQKGAKLGQHLLTNVGIAKIVAYESGAGAGSRVYEIGPGKGILTRELLALGATVHAVEKDPSMVEYLAQEFEKEIREKKLVLIQGDARDATPDTIFPKGEYVVGANIPYYITGELIRTALTSKNQPKTIALLVQKEVAERIVGRKQLAVGRKPKESILSLSVKAYGTPTYIKTVSKGSFAPPPSVDSAIIRVENISRRHFKGLSEEMFFGAVKAGFAQKRKTLGGNLKKVFGERSLDALHASDVPANIRAEDVPLEKWLSIAEKLS